MFQQSEMTPSGGWLHALDSRIKVLFGAALLIIISLKSAPGDLILINAGIALLALTSRVDLPAFYGRAIPAAALFGFLLSAPAMLNIITPGSVVIPLIDFAQVREFWIYTIPAQLGITAEGFRVCAVITLRVLASVSVSLLVLFTTSFADIIRALKIFRVPDVVLLIISLTYKYLYIFALMLSDMYQAKKARMVSGVTSEKFRSWSAGRMGYIFRKTQTRCDDIYRAMMSRGFNGEVKIMFTPSLGNKDYIGGLALLFLVMAALLR